MSIYIIYSKYGWKMARERSKRIKPCRARTAKHEMCPQKVDSGLSSLSKSPAEEPDARAVVSHPLNLSLLFNRNV